MGGYSWIMVLCNDLLCVFDEFLYSCRFSWQRFLCNMDHELSICVRMCDVKVEIYWDCLLILQFCRCMECYRCFTGVNKIRCRMDFFSRMHVCCAWYFLSLWNIWYVQQSVWFSSPLWHMFSASPPTSCFLHFDRRSHLQVRISIDTPVKIGRASCRERV